MDASLEPRLLLDPETTANEKRSRERHFHLVEVPRLRILGFAILTLLVVFHEVFSTGATDWRLPIRIGAALLAYALASWAALRLLFDAARPSVNLGTLFLALDIPAFVWVIYETGADNSWLFFLLHQGRGPDQHDVQARARFSHVAAASYVMLILYLRLRRHRPISWPTEAFKLLILYGANLYVSLHVAHRRAAARADGRRDPHRAGSPCA